MLETLLLILVTAAAGLVAFLVIYPRWHYGTLEKLGIPVAKPHFLLGSDPDGHKIIFQDRDLERFKKYGPIFGVYEGRMPRVMVVDPEMIRLIMVKDFDHFHDRSVPEWGHEIFDNLLDFLPGEKWKTVRSALTPMFTSSRIRSGSKLFMDLTAKNVKDLKEQAEGDRVKIDFKDFMSPVVVEFIADYFLCVKLDGEENIRENYVYKMAIEAVNDGMEPSWIFTLITVYPFTLKFLPLFSNDGIRKFLCTLDQIIKARIEANKDTSSGKDFIDVMVSMFEKLDSAEFKRLGIDKVCVQSQAFEMFIAGFDSILGTLSIVSYHLANNSEIQEKVLEEVDNYFSKSEKERNSGDLSDLMYLTACVKEAIRLSPSFHRPERLCKKDWSYKNEEKGIDITIPKGMSVMIPSWATNRNPEVFKDPEEFKPERYHKTRGDADNETSADNVAFQFSNTSFGHGPRNCPGSRLGIEMVKAGLATILKDFKFEVRDDTKVQLQEGIPQITRYHPIILNVVKRVEQ